jgi:hypothetical protein
MRRALGRGAAEGSAMRRRCGRLEWHREEGDDPDERGPPVGEREETRCQGEIHKPEWKTYSREYANVNDFQQYLQENVIVRTPTFSNSNDFQLPNGFWNWAGIWEFAQGDLGGILMQSFFLNSSRILKDFRKKLQYAMP